jgi:putative DNA primase/helicase
MSYEDILKRYADIDCNDDAAMEEMMEAHRRLASEEASRSNPKHEGENWQCRIIELSQAKLCEAYLRERGLDVDFARANGVELEVMPPAKRIIERLGKDFLIGGKPLSESIREIMWFPLCNHEDHLKSWFGRPLPDIDHESKFVFAFESAPFPYVPKAVWAIRKKTALDIIFTDGPIKALVLQQAGAMSIALDSVWMISGDNTEEKRYPLGTELEDFEWVGRIAYLGFDADQNSNPKLLRTVIRTAFLLRIQGAQVLQLTHWPESEGKGIDDYLVRKAGCDPGRQRECLAVLKDQQKVLPFIDTLRPFMLPVVETELRKIMMSPIQRSQLCKELAVPLQVRAAALEEGTFSVESIRAEEMLRCQETIKPWPDPVDGAELLQQIFGIFERFIFVPDRGFITVTIWTLLPYVYEEFHKLPVLRIKSPQKRCGKSTLLDVLELLTIRPLLTVSITPPTLYRLIERFHPTVLVDEAEKFGKEDDELRCIVNGGYERNRPAWRTNKETMEPESFSTFGCKVLASIRSLDETIEDRSVFVDMARKPRGLELEELCDADPEVFAVLRRKIQRWSDDNRASLRALRLQRPKSLVDRSWNKWRSLLSIAHVAGGQWYQMALKTASDMTAEHDSELNTGAEVLSHIRAFFRKGGGVIDESKGAFGPSVDILQYLNSDVEASWADWKHVDENGNTKKGMTAKQLGQILKPFKIKSDRPTIARARYHGYWLKDFEEAFDSYLDPEQPDPPKAETDA